MSRWDTSGLITGPNWLVDALGNVVGYRNKVGADFQIAAQSLPSGAESVTPGALLSPGGAGVVFTSIINGLVPASGGGTTFFLRADGTWVAPPVSTSLFSSVANGIVPLSGGGTANFLRADGAWVAPAVGPSYSNFTAVAAGLTPLSGGGTTNFLRADGTWSTPPGSNYSVFNSTTAGLVPSSGGGTTTFLRADGSFTSPIGTTYVNFTSTIAGLVPASGGGTTTYLRADGTFATPAGSGDMVLSGTQTVTGPKTFNDGFFKLAGATSGVTTLKATAVAGSTTWTFPASNDTVVGLTAAQTLVNKILTSPTIATILNGAGTLTVPSTTDTLVGRATADTMTNKTLQDPIITGNGVAVTQAPGDNTTKLATTAFVAALGASKAGLATFSSLSNGLTPASGGGTTSWLRADGAWASLPANLDPAVAVSYSTVVPLDKDGNGKYMPRHTLVADTTFTLGASPMEQGNCNINLVSDATHTVTWTAPFSLANGFAFPTVAGQQAFYAIVYTDTTALVYGSLGTLFDLTVPTLISATVPDSDPLRINLVWSEAMLSTVSAAAAFTISAGHTVTNHTYDSGTTSHLTITTPFIGGESKTLAYAQPGSNKMQDLSANLVVNFSGTAITNSVSTPTLVSAVVANATPTKIDLTWSEAMNTTVSAATNFAVSSGHALTGHVNIDATHTQLTTSTAFVNGETKTLSYTPNGTNDMKDSAGGNLVAAFSGTAITDNVTTVSGSITTSNQTMPGSINLTSAGYRDYYRRRLGQGGANLQKTGRPFIVATEAGSVGDGSTSSYVPIPSLPSVTASDWVFASDGTAVGTITESTGEVIFDNGGGGVSYTLQVPAGTTPQVVDIIWGSARNDTFSVPGNGSIRIELSDSSHSPVTVTATAPSNTLDANCYYTKITFNAATNGQTLTIYFNVTGATPQGLSVWQVMILE